MLYAFFLATQVNINELSENICKHTLSSYLGLKYLKNI